MTDPAKAAAGRKGAYTSWANTVDRAARVQAAVRRSPSHVEWHLERLGPLFDSATEEQRHQAAEAARRAYMVDLQMKSAAARRRAGMPAKLHRGVADVNDGRGLALDDVLRTAGLD